VECAGAVAMMYAIRGICLNLCKWPVPSNFIFKDPGFPSIFVSYEKANDLYFSGHTGSTATIFFGHYH